MKYLLSPEGREALRAVAGGPMLYAFDFDGTLAKISSERESVKLTRSIHEWLVELAKRAPCAVISGRALTRFGSESERGRSVSDRQSWAGKPLDAASDAPLGRWDLCRVESCDQGRAGTASG